MLGHLDAAANLAVKDLAVARRFYEGTLGLSVAATESDGLFTCRSGNTLINVYRSDEAGTNKATAVTWWSAIRSRTSLPSCAPRTCASSMTTCRG